MIDKTIKISEMPADKNFEDYPEDTIFVLEDKPRLFDEKNGKFLFPGQPGYDELYAIISR